MAKSLFGLDPGQATGFFVPMRYPTLAIKEHDSFPDGIDYRNQRSQLGRRLKVCPLEISLRLDCLRDIACNRIDQLFSWCRHSCPRQPSVRAVLALVPVSEIDSGLALSQLLSFS